MGIYQHISEFAGLPVVDWSSDAEQTLSDAVVPRVSLEYDEAEEGVRWVDKFAALLNQPGVETLRGLVVGPWDESMASEDDSAAVVEALVNARDRLPNLRAIFLGDITSEESEISWINQSDIAPLFTAYPLLEELWVRGGQGLRLGRVRHDHLRVFVIQSGGLPGAVVRDVAAAELPNLEHLELWLGADDYGGDATLEDLVPILDGSRFPKLCYLGLRDSEIADEIAQAVVNAPILERIQTLDLSLGTLGDDGAEALRTSPLVRKLQKLDIHHHFCSDDIIVKLQGLGVELDASDQQKEDEYDGERYRYAAVTE